jgi:predicted phosphodiesterase
MIAVLGDIHGNLWALEAVLAEVDRLRPEHVVVAGDLALGGPRPAECVASIRRRGYPTIRCNTDEWLTGQPKRVHDVITWTSAQLGLENRRYLAGLPFLWRLPHDSEDLVVVHATPWIVSDLVAPDAPIELASRVLDEANAAVVVYGHIHIAYVRAIGKDLLVNAGSVGLPFDGDSRASYVTLEASGNGWKATLRRVSYRVDEAAKAARASDNPEGTLWARRLEAASRVQ